VEYITEQKPGLLFRLLVHHLLPAPFTIFFEFNFALNLLLIFPAPVVDAFAFSARELYEFILGHNSKFLQYKVSVTIDDFITTVNHEIKRSTVLLLYPNDHLPHLHFHEPKNHLSPCLIFLFFHLSSHLGKYCHQQHSC